MMQEPSHKSEIPLAESNRLNFAQSGEKLNHNVFRFPAKFHPPAARTLVEKFSEPGHSILDPFCGSGTLLVEGMLAGRAVVGTDIDPLAIFLSQAKTTNYDVVALQDFTESLSERILALSEVDSERDGDYQKDISEDLFQSRFDELASLIPAIPRLTHWFRKRVILQLAEISALINEMAQSRQHRQFGYLMFASIIRNASNADPVPVSGLEVTHHMRKREAAGRTINPYVLFRTACKKVFEGQQSFISAMKGNHFRVRVAQADARQLSVAGTGLVDSVITSPPYLSAVDYYRRHQLEMFWLGLTNSQADRLQLLPGYIGRNAVTLRDIQSYKMPVRSALGRHWIKQLNITNIPRSRALSHYAHSMSSTLDRLLEVTRIGGQVVIVIGDSQIQSEIFPTSRMIEELAPRRLVLEAEYWYPIENRFMSYSRHNGADIKIERVLAFRRV